MPGRRPSAPRAPRPRARPPQVRDADNTFALAAAAAPGSGGYYVGGRAARPVGPAADARVQDELWALWEQQTGGPFTV